jgi:hypothetical protein
VAKGGAATKTKGDIEGAIADYTDAIERQTKASYSYKLLLNRGCRQDCEAIFSVVYFNRGRAKIEVVTDTYASSPLAMKYHESVATLYRP